MKKQKKGVSILVGYILLIVFAIIISGIAFVWLRSYVPRDSLACDEGTEIAISSASFTASSGILNITIKNNGRFSVSGYFIHASNTSGVDVDTIDLSLYLNESFGGKFFGNSILFLDSSGNSFDPGEQTSHRFDIPSTYGTIYTISLTPARFQVEDNKQRYVSCSEGLARKDVLIN